MQIQWDIFDTSWQLFWINLRENNWQEMLLRYFATGGRRILCSSDALARNINRSQKRPQLHWRWTVEWHDGLRYTIRGRSQMTSANFLEFWTPSPPCQCQIHATSLPIIRNWPTPSLPLSSDWQWHQIDITGMRWVWCYPSQWGKCLLSVISTSPQMALSG